MTAFVDTSVWFAAANRRDAGHERARRVLRDAGALLLTDHILVETWRLLNTRVHRKAADRFWHNVREGGADLAFVTPADLDAAWAIGEAFPDQDFSIVDQTSFAVMERLRIARVASFDEHFAVYRYGRKREQAFEILR